MSYCWDRMDLESSSEMLRKSHRSLTSRQPRHAIGGNTNIEWTDSITRRHVGTSDICSSVMTLTMPQLLRLPPNVRSQVLSDASSLLRPAYTQKCQDQARLLLRRSYVQSKAPPKPAVRKPATSGSAPPKPRAAPFKAQYTDSMNSYAQRLCGDADQVLIYNSPNHRGYVFSCYFTGAVLLLGATVTLNIGQRSPPSSSDSTAPRKSTPYLVRVLNAIPSIMFAMMGTVAILAPSKMIRRIWLLRPSTTSPNQYMLHFETKAMLPFRKNGRTLSSALSNVSIDRNIHSSAADLTWHNVPVASSKAFTAHYLPSTHPSHARGERQPATLSSRLGSLNASLLQAWPSVVRNIKRMFVREGIAYVHVIGEDGQWKLDLHDAEVLDGGRPMAELMATDVRMARGVVPWVQRLMGKVDAATGVGGR